MEKSNSFLIKFKNTSNGLFKKSISKLNNYRTTSIIIAVLGVISILTAIGTLLFYEFAGSFDKEINMQITAFADKPIHGMILFLSCIFIIILGIVAVYISVPAIVNKDVVQTKRSHIIASIAIGVFELIVAIFIVILLTSKEKIKTTGGFTAMLILLILNAIASLLLFIPYFKCVFYMPPIKK